MDWEHQGKEQLQGEITIRKMAQLGGVELTVSFCAASKIDAGLSPS